MATSLIRQLLQKMTGSKQQRKALQRVDLSTNPLSHRQISGNALKVIERLQARNYQAYLVGGGVRDLLLNMRPKDFDVATDATPEQVRACFGNARIIGRRFRLVHVRFGREVIEVATFRTNHEDDSKVARSQEGMLLRDNHWGNIEDDAWRRDFTVNALYYDSEKQEMLAFPGSMQDMEQRTLRIIGDAATRYREDPVRMLRAARFAVKLGFTIEESTRAPVPQLADLLQKVPAARLFDEVIKLLMSGYGLDTFRIANELGLMAPMFPDSWEALSKDSSGQLLAMIEKGLDNTDQRIRADRPVTPAFLYGVLLWPAVVFNWQRQLAKGTPSSPALNQAITLVLARHASCVAIPKRFSIPMREIWELQPRLMQTQGRRALATLNHPRFRAAYDFLLLREQSGEDLNQLGQWWTKAWQQLEMGEMDLSDLPPPVTEASEQRVRTRRKPRNRKPSHD